ncbi:hypothetical protein BIW11_12381 [Tropilaelaps mercedesae]|uniref:Uncharacterized protein n=1 Tax=Tropilaelaps mercedesae TaxID=418985 RepID=A0A1V9X6W4_9ACAR|nr:hypothetical protein BIW11_12381 [Tropilaelaps mercedesae]
MTVICSRVGFLLSGLRFFRCPKLQETGAKIFCGVVHRFDAQDDDDDGRNIDARIVYAVHQN